MRIEKSSMGDVVLLKISGKISFTDIQTLKTMLRKLAISGKEKILVDCANMDSLNSQALATFMSAYRMLKEGFISFANANPHVRAVFETTHLDQRFHLYDTIEDAITEMKFA